MTWKVYKLNLDKPLQPQDYELYALWLHISHILPNYLHESSCTSELFEFEEKLKDIVSIPATPPAQGGLLSIVWSSAKRKEDERASQV